MLSLEACIDGFMKKFTHVDAILLPDGLHVWAVATYLMDSYILEVPREFLKSV